MSNKYFDEPKMVNGFKVRRLKTEEIEKDMITDDINNKKSDQCQAYMCQEKWTVPFEDDRDSGLCEEHADNLR